MKSQEIQLTLYRGLSLYNEGKVSKVIVTKKDGTVIEGVVISASDPLVSTFGIWRVQDLNGEVHKFAIRNVEKVVLFVEAGSQE